MQKGRIMVVVMPTFRSKHACFESIVISQDNSYPVQGSDPEAQIVAQGQY
jgi:hypothetical protein